MKRESFALDGVWDFHFGGHEAVPPSATTEWRAAAVPMPWQAQFPDLRLALGTAWYRRRFSCPADWRSDAVVLCFGAVSYLAEVTLNGFTLGWHEGGYLPFEFSAGEALRAGAENELIVRVVAPSDDEERYGDMAFGATPFGKQSWYGPLSGIWQSVRVERRARVHVESLRLRSCWTTGEVSLSIALTASPAPFVMDLEIDDPAGRLAASSPIAVDAGQTMVETTLNVENPAAWSPTHPLLYRCRVLLPEDGYQSTFGFRTFAAKDGRFLLNGEPFHLRAALDQDYYPDSIATVPSTEFLEDQIRKAKELGLNCLRCHIKVPDPRYYEVADRLGMLIWSELPNGRIATEAAVLRTEETLRGLVARDMNHPSIVIWTIVNENWGHDLVHDAGQRVWLARTYGWLKSEDPTRLVVDNSPLWPSFHVKSDVADVHFYKGMPDHREEWDAFVVAYATESLAAVYSAAGDAAIAGDEPRMISEFGNWGLPDPADLVDADGREPWWFETGHDWADGVMYPHGIEQRFAAAGLPRVFGGLRAFALACQWQQFYALKHQIESMRRQPSLAGYVITELADAHWECNGLLDMRRNPRAFHTVFHEVNGDRVLIAGGPRRALWAGETVSIGITLANGGKALLPGALDARFDGETIPALSHAEAEAGSVAEIGRFDLTVPSLDAPRIAALTVDIGVARTHLHLALHPRRSMPAGAFRLWSDDCKVANYLRALDYPIVDDLAEADLAVVAAPSRVLEAFVRGSGSALILADRPMALEPLFPHWQNVQIVERAGTSWQGDWASSFAWLRREAAFARLPGGPLLDDSFERVYPRCVINNCNALDFHARVHAGLVVGWIHKAVALIIEGRYGAGRFALSTFRLFEDAPGADPMATILTDALIETVMKRSPSPQAPVENAETFAL
jgi:hypothetical protein